jgi:hypothetical protein
MKQKMLLLGFFLLFVTFSFIVTYKNIGSSNIEIIWGKQFGTDKNEEITGVTVDSQGNIYVIGSTEGNLFGTNVGGKDIFIAKFSPGGELIWGKQLGTIEDDVPFDIAVDSDRNFYVVGATYGDLFGKLVRKWSEDAFVVKFSSKGEIIWSKQFGTPGQDWAEGVAIDNKNRMIYIVGFLQIGEFGDLEAKVFEEETYEEIFLIKYDFEGNKIYEKLYGTKRNDAGRSICIDNEDNIYIVGDTDGGWFIENETKGKNSFIVKLTSKGNILWGKEFGSNEQDYAIDVYVDKNGDIYVVGVMNIKETFDTADAFICKYDKNGNQIWMKEIKVDGKEDVISGIKVKEGNVYIVGYREGNLFSENKGKSDIFIAKYNTNGEFIWGEMIGTEQGDSGNDIVIDAQGNIYLVGDTEGNLFGANIGGWDVFIIKFRDKS